MAVRPAYPCRKCGVAIRQYPCPRCGEGKRVDRRPPSHKRGYDSKWADLRAWYIREHPLCELCLAKGETRAGQVVHHIRPLKEGGSRLDQENLMTLCNQCHAEVHGQGDQLVGIHNYGNEGVGNEGSRCGCWREGSRGGDRLTVVMPRKKVMPGPVHFSVKLPGEPPPAHFFVSQIKNL